MFPLPEYWSAVAEGIDAENKRVSILLRGGQKESIGLAREEILRHLLTGQAPAPLKVRSGFICKVVDQQIRRSRQCDVLVYDPTRCPPYYETERFSIVEWSAAKVAAEVKTKLGQDSLKEAMALTESISWHNVPTFCFAFGGWGFKKCLENLRASVASRRMAVPACIAVHSQNYIFFRNPVSLVSGAPQNFFALNFNATENTRGWATAFFLELFAQCLRGPMGDLGLRW